jgi:hypothetical protein
MLKRVIQSVSPGFWNLLDAHAPVNIQRGFPVSRACLLTEGFQSHVDDWLCCAAEADEEAQLIPVISTSPQVSAGVVQSLHGCLCKIHQDGAN